MVGDRDPHGSPRSPRRASPSPQASSTPRRPCRSRGAESQDLVPYDEDAQRVLSRAFEIAIADGADMVDVSQVTEALREVLPAS